MEQVQEEERHCTSPFIQGGRDSSNSFLISLTSGKNSSPRPVIITDTENMGHLTKGIDRGSLDAFN